MADRLGRYLNTKTVEEIAPEWAKGCSECNGGIVNAKPLPNETHLVEERIGQMQRGEIHFCSCKAGEMYEQHLVNTRLKINGMYDQMAKSANGTPHHEKEKAKHSR